MTRSIGLAHVIRKDNGTSEGVWGTYVLCSAFQPIFRFTEGKLVIAAFEGLVRPFRDGEPVSPFAFFRSIPEQDQLEVETLTRTLHLLNAGRCLDKRTDLFINFDPSVFTDREIADRVLREMRLTLHEADIDPARIVCEITEHSVDSQAGLLDFAAALRDNGFRIAVDDYGADDSDIGRIRDLRPEIVKFDAAWIVQLMDSDPGFELLKSMVSTFRSWGITTLFEGIEEPWQLELAESCQVNLIQGFVLARPQLAPTEFAVFSGPQQAGGTPEAEAAAQPEPPFAEPADAPAEAPTQVVDFSAGADAAKMPAVDRRSSLKGGWGQPARVFGRRGRHV
ncbi:diguanylate phosphodiesterase [Zhengella mangrovi]|uniref:Diguanylate phosphodiesterase n=1 Tax=Zhengella mangrovi TaxID=1982044 RepID=A0A2G1QI38_9HYPH|nr:EAL domain-containing protein [Zhengella mangrovi]PHP64868.1 diguanylate phosphodiesterase [Zhengella mangrovi]